MDNMEIYICEYIHSLEKRKTAPLCSGSRSSFKKATALCSGISVFLFQHEYMLSQHNMRDSIALWCEPYFDKTAPFCSGIGFCLNMRGCTGKYKFLHCYVLTALDSTGKYEVSAL